MPSKTKTEQQQSQQQQSQQISSNTLDPGFKSAVYGNLDTAKQNAASLVPYTGQMVANFTPTQLDAFGAMKAAGVDPSFVANNNSAITGYSRIANNPLNGNISAPTVAPSMSAGAPGVSAALSAGAPTVTAGQLSGVDLSKYLNPFTDNVVNTTISDQERARQIAQASDSRQAAAQGAFGGSRSGVMAAETNGNYDRNTASLLAGLRQAGFTQAQNAALSDIGNSLDASKFNATSTLNNNQFNAGSVNDANRFNATNAMGTNQFNATQGQNADILNASNGMAAQNDSFTNNLNANNQSVNALNNLMTANNNGLNIASNQAGLLSAVGDAQQQHDQDTLTAAFNSYLQGVQLTTQQQAMLNSALGLIPVEQTQTNNGNSTSNSDSTTTQTQQMGLGQMLQMAGSLAMAAGTGGASLGLTGALGGLGSLGAGAGLLGQMTGSNAVGYGGLLGAAAPTVGLGNPQVSLPSFNIPMPRVY